MKSTYHLFEAYGVELEYMIVDKKTLDIQPLTDKILFEICGSYDCEVSLGEINWSNELVLHVIELKTNGPAKSLQPLGGLFQDSVNRINKMLEAYNAMLLPSAMHPWMDPYKEMHLWPHENSPIYEAYNRIFNCQGHGWANLQSTHINLPFANDEEFGRLHAAIRLILPLVPAFAASSPVADCSIAPHRDYRVDVYRYNQAKVPSITGKIVPEAVFTEQDYRQNILQRMYNDIASYDQEGTLQDEWLNSRGAIARFDRNTIEIRLVDIQECVKADMAIVCFIVDVLKAIIHDKWIAFDQQKQIHEDQLSAVLSDTVRVGCKALITDQNYLKAFGMDCDCNAGDVLKKLIKEVDDPANAWKDVMNTIMEEGSLADRILSALGGNSSKKNLEKVYRQLAQCLAENKMFHHAGV
jgi:carboxylate-amine ligase